MKSHFLFLLLAGIAFSMNLNAQSDPVMEKIVKIGQTDNQTMDHLDILCNRFGGRLIGSDAYENAGIWAGHAGSQALTRRLLCREGRRARKTSQKREKEAELEVRKMLFI